MAGASPSSTQSSQPGWVANALHVFVLSGFAIAQPVYDLLGKHAAFFVARGSKPVDVIVLVLALSLVLPAILVGGLLLSRALGVGTYKATLALSQVALVAGAVLPALKTSGWRVATLVAIGCGLLFALAYRKLPAVPLFLTLVAPAILIFPAVFVLATPVSKIVFPTETPEAAAISLPPDSHVVFLIFDLLPVTALMDEDQNLDVERYPGFARMQAQSSWFRQARTVSRATVQAVPALLTGLYPRKEKLALLEDYPKNLFTLFGTAGDIHAIEPMTRLCPETLCGANRRLSTRARLASLARDTAIVTLHLLVPKRFTGRLPPIDSQWGSFDAMADGKTTKPDPRQTLEDGRKETRKEMRARLKKELNKLPEALASQDRLKGFDAFLEALGGRAARNLSFLHLDLPHGPFVYLASGKKYVPKGKKYKRLKYALGKGSGKPGSRTWGPDPYLVDLAYLRLTHQIMLADKLVGRLLDRLEELDILDRSLVIVTADHGQNYEPDGFQRSMADADTAHVPLFIKFPGQRQGQVDDRVAETVDVLPTIIDTLDLNLDWRLEGSSLKAGSEGKRAAGRRQPRELKRDLATCLLRKLDRVAARSPELPGVGKHRELVGQQVADALRAAPDGLQVSPLRQVRLDQEALLKNVDPDSDFVPAYLTGSVNLGRDGEIADLAIALNGVIRATLTTYLTMRGKARFAAMVPESSFLAGTNTWEVFRLQDGNRR